MPTVNEIFGDFHVLKLGGRTLGHLWRNVPVATREDLEACVQACNEVRNLAHESNKIICEASKWSPTGTAVSKVWKEIKLKFDTVNTLINFHNTSVPLSDPVGPTEWAGDIR